MNTIVTSQQLAEEGNGYVDTAAELYGRTNVSSSEAATHALIGEYLVHGCYTETARAFGVAAGGKHRDGDAATNNAVESSETAMEMDIDADNSATTGQTTTKPPFASAASLVAAQSLAVRKNLNSLVLAGRIADAVAAADAAFPGALKAASADSTAVCFLLHTQQFIELVRVLSADALRFAQEELGQYSDLNPKHHDALRDIVSLIAYTDPYTSPLAHYLSLQRREEVATHLNGFLLAHQNLSPDTALERIVRQATVLRDFLSEPAIKEKKSAPKAVLYPKWDLGLFLDAQSS
ncbi:hypothetical protein CcCBS67573_g01319 [Chytriomyces confervae]|uniref:CTLH domain-containing protein n=1 Tax=Chytriomyces confervae TaxID=246404 RepID=A0A507FQ26_9FUNG|nr:hypothetical protein CcCBS67573_g01319 [Chytriomyces confervae]